MKDFTLVNHLSLFLLTAHTDDARNWVEANLSADRLSWGRDGTAIEPRYVGAIVAGIESDGLVVA
jgi:hypothetical protein